MNDFGFLDTPYTPGGASLVLEKIWSKIEQCSVIAYMAKYFCIGFSPYFLVSGLLFLRINVCILVVATIRILPKTQLKMGFHALFAIPAPFVRYLRR